MVRRIVTCLALLAPALSAGQSAPTMEDLLKQATAVQAHPDAYVTEPELRAWQQPLASPQAAADALGEPVGSAAAPAQSAAGGASGAGVRFDLFISLGMAPGALASAVDLARTDPRVTLVLRGAPPGQRVQEVAQAIRAAGSVPAGEEGGTVPSTLIDPPRFRDMGIDHVPVMVRMQEGVTTTRVRGLFNPQWLDEQVATGHTGDLGQHGPTYAITEDDMEERIKTALANMDFEAQRTRALRHAWDNLPMIDLPTASRDSERELDPTITAQQSLIAPDGRVIFQEGQRINPLELVPMHTRLVIIDPRDPAQVAFAREQGRKANDDVMYLFTRLAGDEPWQAHAQLVGELGRPVYLFVDAVRERFGVRAVPTVIEAAGTRFRITEYALPSAQPLAAGSTDAHAHPAQR